MSSQITRSLFLTHCFLLWHCCKCQTNSLAWCLQHNHLPWMSDFGFLCLHCRKIIIIALTIVLCLVWTIIQNIWSWAQILPILPIFHIFVSWHELLTSVPKRITIESNMSLRWMHSEQCSLFFLFSSTDRASAVVPVFIGNGPSFKSLAICPLCLWILSDSFSSIIVTSL